MGASWNMGRIVVMSVTLKDPSCQKWRLDHHPLPYTFIPRNTLRNQCVCSSSLHLLWSGCCLIGVAGDYLVILICVYWCLHIHPSGDHPRAAGTLSCIFNNCPKQ